jgi:hypothetical protein
MIALDRLGAPYRVVVEESEYDKYAEHIPEAQLLTLPQKYLDEYDTFDDLGDTCSKGPGSARNFAWEHSIQEGHDRHWVMDDNLDDFHRLNRNVRVPVRTCATICAAEDFVDRYENVYISGFNYYSFCKSSDKVYPFTMNTRIYSCLLIQNDIPYRWRGRYNEDTDICLRVLKDGHCTVQFNAFLCGKVTTQRMAGGNTEEFYKHEGTHPKSQMIVDMHPDVARLSSRFSRVHHHVDYKPFKENKLIKKEGVEIPRRINNYGMNLTRIEKTDKTFDFKGLDSSK